MRRRCRTYPLLASAYVLVLGMAGCGTCKTYRLPLSATSAPATFLSIASTARQMDLEVAEFDGAVHVKLDAATWVHYTIQVNEYNLVVMIDQGEVPDAELESRFVSAKQKADQIWRRAITDH